MKYLLTLLLFPMFVQCNNGQQTDEAKASVQAPTHSKNSGLELADEVAMDTAKPAMQQAWYEYEADAKTSVAIYRAGFVVLADTNFKATDFASVEEKLLRYYSTVADTTVSYYRTFWVKPWKGLTSRQRRIRIAREQAAFARQADSLHTLNNRGRYRVWLINNSADTIVLATQDESLICVLQAQDSRKQWQPVQFWSFSDCGNSDIARYLLPKERVAFLAKIPRHGNFKTTLRYKLAGVTRFYYSNEFEGRINYGDFREHPQFYFNAEGIRRQSSIKSFKLDSLFSADYRGNVASSFWHSGKTIRLLPH